MQDIQKLKIKLQNTDASPEAWQTRFAISELQDALLVIDWKNFNININPLLTALTNLKGAWLSQSEDGWQVERNRRKAVYEKLMNNYFSDEWDIEINNNYFTLKRKVI